MALGPEQVLANIKGIKDAKEAALAEERRLALSFVKTIADCAEKILDGKIPSSEGKQVQIVWADMEKAFKYGETMRLVIEHAGKEFQEILEKRYLPRGWGSIQIGSCYINLNL
jgi:hypothetical protein